MICRVDGFPGGPQASLQEAAELWSIFATSDMITIAHDSLMHSCRATRLQDTQAGRAGYSRAKPCPRLETPGFFRKNAAALCSAAQRCCASRSCSVSIDVYLTRERGVGHWFIVQMFECLVSALSKPICATKGLSAELLRV